MAEKAKKFNWTQPVKKGSKSTKILVKLYLIIFILLAVLYFLNKFVDNHTVNSKSIYALIGNNVSVSVGSKTSLLIREYSIIPFAEFLKMGDYESAYNMCTEEYQEYFSLDDFRSTFSQIDPNSIELEEVQAKTDYCYEAKVVYRILGEKITYTNASGETIETKGKQYETTYMLFPNEFKSEIIKISPNKFLFGYKNQSFKNNGIELNVEKCLVYTDHMELKAKLKNVSLFSKVAVKSVGLGYEDGLLRTFNVDKSLAKDEEIKIEHTITDTNFFLPNNIKIDRIMNEKKLRTYTFYFGDEKSA